jgi:hypothetical protein
MRTMSLRCSVLLCLLSASLMVQAAPVSKGDLGIAAALRDQALAGSEAYRLVESLTVEVGARVAGTPEEARAAEWAVREMKRIGLANVRVEEFEMEGWVRGPERAETTAPFRHPLVISTLPRSVPTPPGGIEAEAVLFDSLESLLAAPIGSLDGKIAVVTYRAVKVMDGSGYGYAVRARRSGAVEAARRGAVAFMMRSAGTHLNRYANTGSLAYAEGVPKIPAAALSPPDAGQLERLAKRGPVRIRFETQPTLPGMVTSRNVIGDIIGRERQNEFVLISAHLDSWDGGTGALDDGAGIGITGAAAKLIVALPQRPKRSIRVIFFGAEEFGLLGARAYVARHRDRLGEYFIGNQADAGGELPYAFRTRVAESALPAFDGIRSVLAPLDIIPGDNLASGGPDMTPFREAGVPVFDIEQDVTDYFDLHHTPSDTLEQVDGRKLDVNVAAWAATTWLLANMEATLRPEAAPAVAPRPD